MGLELNPATFTAATSVAPTERRPLNHSAAQEIRSGDGEPELNAQDQLPRSYPALASATATVDKSIVDRFRSFFLGSSQSAPAKSLASDIQTGDTQARPTTADVHSDLHPVAPKFVEQVRSQPPTSKPADDDEWDLLPEMAPTPAPTLPASGGSPDIPVATAADTADFILNQQHAAIKALSIEGPHVLVGTGSHVIKMAAADLTRAIAEGKLQPDSALARGLAVREAATTAGLERRAVRAIMTSYTQALASGKDAVTAHRIAHQSLQTAIQVEAYVASGDGLQSDIGRVANFTHDAFSSQATGSDIAAMRNRTINASAIRTQQATLDAGLYGFTEAFAAARATGDYSQALDKLQSFVSLSAKVGTTDYWRNRPETVKAALQPPASHFVAAPFTDLLAIKPPEVAPVKAIAVAAQSPVAASGGFFTDLKARILDVFSKPDTVGTTHSAVQAGKDLAARLAALDGNAVTGMLYRAPLQPEPVSPSTSPRAPKAPVPLPTARPSLKPSATFEEEPEALELEDVQPKNLQAKAPVAPHDARPSQTTNVPPQELTNHDSDVRLGDVTVKSGAKIMSYQEPEGNSETRITIDTLNMETNSLFVGVMANYTDIVNTNTNSTTLSMINGENIEDIVAVEKPTLSPEMDKTLVDEMPFGHSVDVEYEEISRPGSINIYQKLFVASADDSNGHGQKPTSPSLMVGIAGSITADTVNIVQKLRYQVSSTPGENEQDGDMRAKKLRAASARASKPHQGPKDRTANFWIGGKVHVGVLNIIQEVFIKPSQAPAVTAEGASPLMAFSRAKSSGPPIQHGNGGPMAMIWLGGEIHARVINQVQTQEAAPR